MFSSLFNVCSRTHKQSQDKVLSCSFFFYSDKTVSYMPLFYVDTKRTTYAQLEFSLKIRRERERGRYVWRKRSRIGEIRGSKRERNRDRNKDTDKERKQLNTIHMNFNRTGVSWKKIQQSVYFQSSTCLL